MANNKKGILLYCDIIHTVEKLDDKTAGELFKHLLRYVNDKDPKTDNILVEIAFEPIKQTLKRDLRKWENRAETSRANGMKGGRPKEPKKPSGLINNPTEPKKPVRVKVKDSVKVKDKVKDKVNKEEILLPFDDNSFIEIWDAWKAFKKEQFRFTYKPIGERGALQDVFDLSGGSMEKACAIILQSIKKGWKGFFELKNNKSGKQTSNLRENFHKKYGTGGTG